MIAAWIAVAAVGAATIAIKGAGPVAFAGRPLPRALAVVMPLLAPSLLAALVVGQTLGDGRALAVDARLAGVAAAAVALLLRAPLLVVLAAAAGVAAGARVLGGWCETHARGGKLANRDAQTRRLVRNPRSPKPATTAPAPHLPHPAQLTFAGPA